MPLRPGRLRPLSLALCGIIAGGVPVALAQEGGLSLRLTVTPSLTWRDNPDLVANPGPAETSLGTGLSFGLRSETRTQRLSLEASGLLDSNDKVGRDGLVDPQLRFDYALEGANARLTAFARYRQTDLDDRSFVLDLDGDGIDDTDPVITFSGGIRQDLSYGFGLETGQRDPIGLALDVSRSDRIFTDTLDPTLYDTEELRVAARASFRIDPRITLRATASQTRYEAEDAEATRRTTTRAGVGGSFAITPALRLEADLRQERVETERLSGDSLSEGLGFDLALTQTLPNGTLGAQASSTFDQNGRRDDLRVTRSMTLANDATLSFGLGLGRTEGFDSRLLAQASYAQDLKNGRIGLRFRQELRNDGDDRALLDTRLNATWSRALGPVTGFTADLALANLDALDAGEDDRRQARLRVDLAHQLSPRDRIAADVGFGVTDISGPGGDRTEDRLDLGLSYSRQLVQDWSLVARYNHVALRESGAADRVGNTVSIGLQKTFEWRN